MHLIYNKLRGATSFPESKRLSGKISYITVWDDKAKVGFILRILSEAEKKSTFDDKYLFRYMEYNIASNGPQCTTYYAEWDYKLCLMLGPITSLEHARKIIPEYRAIDKQLLSKMKRKK